MNLAESVNAVFQKKYKEQPLLIRSPGRVNLIGEHTDYNSGFVLPVAIEKRIVVAAGKRNDGKLFLHTADFQKSVEITLSDIRFREKEFWSNYPAGVAAILQSTGYTIGGANFCIRGDVPIGAGLSASAAMEVASALALSQLYNLSLSPLDVARLACTAEGNFVGVQCGIMDQFISVFGKKGFALFLDCKSLEHSYVVYPDGVTLVIFDTGLRRELALSSYNRREAECEDAVHLIAKHIAGLSSLREVTPDKFRSVEGMLPLVSRKRARHVITENERVLQAVEALKQQDVDKFGKLMFESHKSLKEDYEVSCRELDAFVDIARESKGVFGARMTGAGFGGSAIALVKEKSVDAFVERVRTEYPKRGGPNLTIYLPKIGGGATIATAETGWKPKPFISKNS